MPKKQRPPVTPRLPHQIAKPVISLRQERWIGRVIVRWSRLDNGLDQLIWKLLRLQLEDGRIITARMDTQFKINILRYLGKKHLSEANAIKLHDLLNTIEDLYGDRNYIVHGIWSTLIPDNVPVAQSLREKIDPIAGPKDLMSETFPESRMHAIIDEIERSKYRLTTLLDELST